VLSALDWSVFFEKVSLVDRMLRQDPAGVYAHQDFTTRDRYRQMVEKLARGSGVLEQEVAGLALELAGRSEVSPRSPVEGSRGFPHTDPRTHVGCYLVGKGRAELARRIAYHPPLRDRLREGAQAHPYLVFFGSITLFTVLFLGALLTLAAGLGASVPLLI